MRAGSWLDRVHGRPTPRTRLTLPYVLPSAVYRSAFAEDLDEVGERRAAEEGGFRALRLRRLA